MMSSVSFNHVSIVVKSLEASKHFYGVVLGFKEIPRPPFEFEGAWFELAPGIQLHIILNPSHPHLHVQKTMNQMSPHFALTVKDLKAVHQRVESFQIKADSYRPKHFFVPDPDGNLVEIIEAE